MKKLKKLANHGIIISAIFWGTTVKVVADVQSPQAENNNANSVCYSQLSKRRREAGFVDDKCGNVFRGSLSRGSLSRGSLSRGSLSRGSLSRGSLSRGSLSRGSLSRGSLSRGSLSRGSLSRGSLSRGSLSRGSLSRGSLSRGSLSRGSLSRGSLSRGSLSRGSLSRGSLSRGSFSQESDSSTKTAEAIAPEIVQEEVKQEPLRLPKIVAPFAPEKVGLTVTNQPIFYWYMSYPWNGEVNFSLTEVGASEPIVEYTILPSAREQHTQDNFIYQLRLVDFNVRLQPEREYEWFIFIIMDPEQRTSDWLASGVIRYIEPLQQLTTRLKQTPSAQWYQVYQEENIWYDAIHHLSLQLAKQPNNKALRQIRADLNRQENMPKLAEYDINFPSPCVKCYYPIN